MGEFEYRWLAKSGPPHSLPLTYVQLVVVAFLASNVDVLLDDFFHRLLWSNFTRLEDIIGQVKARNSQNQRRHVLPLQNLLANMGN